MNKNLICSLAITSIFLSHNAYSSELERADAFKVKQSALIASHRLGNIDLYHDDEGFFVERSGSIKRVNNYDIEPSLRDISSEKLEKIEKLGGFISANEMDNGDVTLKLNARGLGGGPLTGALAYWLTKSGCYGTAIAATGTIVVATGGLAGAAVSTGVAATTLGASTGATLASAAITGAGVTASTAAVTTGAVVTSAGGIVGAVAAVESASLAAGAFFTAIPFLP